MSCRTEHGEHSSCVSLTNDRRRRPLESWEFPLARLRLDCFMGEGNCERDCSALSSHLGHPQGRLRRGSVTRPISLKVRCPAMRVVKAETRAALMDVLRVVIVLASGAFQWFTGPPASFLRDAVTQVIARKPVPTYPIWRFR